MENNTLKRESLIDERETILKEIEGKSLKEKFLELFRRKVIRFSLKNNPDWK
jgi:hypothetical protein